MNISKTFLTKALILSKNNTNILYKIYFYNIHTLRISSLLELLSLNRCV